MQSTLHATSRTPHGASRLMQAMSAWSVKTRRASSRHCTDARVYGHATTAMHGITPHSVVHPPQMSEAHQVGTYAISGQLGQPRSGLGSRETQTRERLDDRYELGQQSCMKRLSISDIPGGRGAAQSNAEESIATQSVHTSARSAIT